MFDVTFLYIYDLDFKLAADVKRLRGNDGWMQQQPSDGAAEELSGGGGGDGGSVGGS